MASKGAERRLRKDYLLIKRSPIQNILAEPDPANILNWHYILIGPKDTPYENGIYHGILKFPTDFPFKPPSIIMYTPNGRFKPNERICLSMSDYHPESWNPSWNVSSILVALVSFMVTEDKALGTVSESLETRKRLAKDSYNWCTKYNSRSSAGRKFKELFEEFIEEQEKERKENETKEEYDQMVSNIINKTQKINPQHGENENGNNNNVEEDLAQQSGNTFTQVFMIFFVAVFAAMVRQVLSTVE